MLKLKDFFHLPLLDALVEQVVAEESGLAVVAGLDPRPTSMPAGGGRFLPSGRSAIFGILMREMLMAHPSALALVVTEDRAFARPPRQLQRRIGFSWVEPPLTYTDRITEAVRRRPGLLVIDRLCAETAPAALEAAQEGLRVLSQLDTVFRGSGIVRHLLDLGVPRERLSGLTWVLTVQRMATLCPRCKRPASPDPAQLTALRRRYPELDSLDIQAMRPFFELAEGSRPESVGTFFQADGCPYCRYTGRHGHLAVFDVFRADPDAPSPPAPG